MAEALTILSDLVTITLVVSSMLVVGLGLTPFEIIQPLRGKRLVILAVVANLVVVPLIAVAVLHVIPLDGDHEIGLVLLGVAPGAPLLPKLAEVAKADVPFAVALMAVLILVSVVYLPIALALLLPGIRVNGASIALSLLLAILIPLALGLFVRSRWPDNVHKLVLVLAAVANISLALFLVLMLGLNVGKVLAMFGSGSILAIVVFSVIATAAGYVLGGPRRDIRRVLALGTGQRNMAACFIIANANFADRPQVLVFLAAASVIGGLLALPLAAMFGNNARATGSESGEPV